MRNGNGRNEQPHERTLAAVARSSHSFVEASAPHSGRSGPLFTFFCGSQRFPFWSRPVTSKAIAEESTGWKAPTKSFTFGTTTGKLADTPLSLHLARVDAEEREGADERDRGHLEGQAGELRLRGVLARELLPHVIRVLALQLNQIRGGGQVADDGDEQGGTPLPESP